MYYGKINTHDIANGEGVRVSLFVSGCPHKCKGCFNPETWNYDYGEEFTVDTFKEIIEALAPEHISGLTILGGEPLAPRNILDITALCVGIRRIYPTKTIWLYTGYVWEDVKDEVVYLGRYSYTSIFDYIDVLVDGRFILEEKDISLKFRGSRNQRIIDVPKSLSSGSVVLKEV